MIHPLAFVDDTVTLGEGCVVRQFASVTGPTVMGRECSVAPGCMIHGPRFGDFCRLAGGVMMGPGFWIGDGVFIGPNVTLCNDGWPRAYKAGFEPEAFDGSRWAVIVESGASIGAGAVVLPGVRIGADAMIAAGAVVRSDVPRNHLYVADGDVRPITRAPERMRFAC